MNRSDLDAIRERIEQTTSEQWCMQRHYVGDRYKVVTGGRGETDAIAYGVKLHDAEFIACAREDIVALLKYVEELKRREGQNRASVTFV